MYTERRVAANPQTKPTALGCESAERKAATIRRLLSSFIIITHTYFTDLGTAVKVRSPCPKLYIAAAVAINAAVRGVIRTWVLSHRSRTR